MGKIKLLSENIVHKIAAGEVIERPASVVKELVENSIDADSKSIRIEATGGGKKSIIVADDGIGMSAEDLRLCVMRHATSKMSSPSDLFAISSLGFRGEAMASIGAVSSMSIETRSREENEGARLYLEGGILGDILTFGRGVGTTVKVRNLFFNTPARRKFLRHIDTETRHITQNISNLASAYPSISFEFIHQDRQVLNFKVANRRERARDLLNVIDPLYIEFEESGIRVEGVITSPEECGKSKGKQYLIVRGRPIVSTAISKAIYRGYGGGLPQGMHPSYIVWLDIDPSMIDVNVHPTKKEIRFANEIIIVQTVDKAIQRSLDIPETMGFSYRQEAIIPPNIPKISEEFSDFTLAKKPDTAKNVEEFSNVSENEIDVEQGVLSLTVSSDSISSNYSQSDSVSRDMLSQPEFYKQIADKYILINYEDAIGIIDQQVAHERIRYEEAMAHLKGTNIDVQQLLIPVTIELNSLEMELVRENIRLFERLGFGVREFGLGSIVVDAIPVALEHWDGGQVFYDIINELLDDNEMGVVSIEERLANTYAKRTAIRSGQKLNFDQMKGIVQDLFSSNESYVGPDGKLAVIKISVNELNRMFAS